jgi:hypothetical protein
MCRLDFHNIKETQVNPQADASPDDSAIAQKNQVERMIRIDQYKLIRTENIAYGKSIWVVARGSGAIYETQSQSLSRSPPTIQAKEGTRR